MTLVTLTCGGCARQFERARYMVRMMERRGTKTPACSRACQSIVQRRAVMGLGKIPDEQRLRSKVPNWGGEGCWEFIGGRTNKGYGTVPVWADGRSHTRGAHRLSYQLHVGPIPAGMMVCHRCDNPPCVRPDHLFLGTGSDNLRDMVAKGRIYKRPDVCKRGHPLLGENVYPCAGRRHCRTCRAARKRGEIAA